MVLEKISEVLEIPEVDDSAKSTTELIPKMNGQEFSSFSYDEDNFHCAPHEDIHHIGYNGVQHADPRYKRESEHR